MPRFVCPSVMGKPRHPGLLAGMTKKDFYVGDEAQQKRDALALSWPMENGLITNFDDANKIWRFAFKEIETLPDDQPLIWTEAALINQQQREKVAEIFYEEHGVPAIHFGLQSVLSVYSAGITTALVVDLGDKCDVMPVYEGGSFSHPYEQAIKRLKTTGSDITEHLEQILAERGYHFTTPAEREIVNYLKEQTTYVSLTPDSEITQETSLLLPDGQTITIGNERYRAPEVLFAPALAGKEGMGLHALVYHSIMESGIDMRVELARSILLIGGTSMIPGLAPRIEKELSLLAPSQKWEINVIVPNDRKYAAWIGGTILASIDSFEKLCIAKEMWTEIGPSVLHDQHTW
uniref:Actin n=1 Tax=Arcella intermedia TaxID=1963864 RepID=A0A6B2L7K9_9EUKA